MTDVWYPGIQLKNVQHTNYHSHVGVIVNNIIIIIIIVFIAILLFFIPTVFSYNLKTEKIFFGLLFTGFSGVY